MVGYLPVPQLPTHAPFSKYKLPAQDVQDVEVPAEQVVQVPLQPRNFPLDPKTN